MSPPKPRVTTLTGLLPRRPQRTSHVPSQTESSPDGTRPVNTARVLPRQHVDTFDAPAGGAFVDPAEDMSQS